MTPEVAAILGLSVVTVLLLLGAFLATTRRAGERRGSRSPGEPPLPRAEAEAEAAASAEPSAGHVGIDYPDPRTIKVGDTIECQGARARVLGAMYLSWQGREWTEYLLDDGTRRQRWLSIETHSGLDPGDALHLEVLLWTRVPTQGMVPAKTTLSVEGVEFFPVDRGTAAFRGEGVTSMPERGLLDFADYRAAIARADAVLAAAAPEQEPAAWPVEIWPTWQLPDVRHILIHVLTEVACHSGHLDAVRELIDGTTWLGGNPYAG